MRGKGQCLNGGMGLEPDEEGVAGWGQGQGVWGDQKPGGEVGDTKEHCGVVGTGEQEPGTPGGCWRCRRRDGGMSRSGHHLPLLWGETEK